MTTSTVQPGMRAATAYASPYASPYTPIAVINGTPIYALRGGRSGGGIAIVAGDADGDDDDDLLDEAEGDEQYDEDDELPASMRGKASTKAKKKAAPRADVADDEDDEPDDEEDEDDTPGAIRRMEEALRKANRTAAQYRRAGKTMAKLGIDDLPTYLTSVGIDPETGRPFGADVVDPDGEDLDDQEAGLYEEDARTRQPSRADQARQDKETTRAIRTAEKRAEARVRAELIPILAQTSATNALRNAGFKGSEARLERLLRMIDPDALDITLEAGSFEIEGLDEQISELQDEFPELFPAPVEARSTRTGGTRTRPAARRASGASDVDGGGRGRQPKKAGGWMDQVAARWDRDGR
jgi:hypothetical protein